jgi:glycogen debranching enzyme
VQAYVYLAKRGAAELAEALGQEQRAVALRVEAESLRERFESAFWCEELSAYGLALDGQKRLCRVRTSNAGQCLYSGIVSPERAERVARTLLDDGSFCGWGIRTLAASEVRFNPMSYHNGTVWPHDNAIIAAGMARYRLTSAAFQVMAGLFDASLFMDLNRMPELFCGFARRAGEAPTLYPVACSPQSWAAGSVYLLLQACLGLEIDAPRRQLLFAYPVLPAFLKWVRIKDLRIGDASIDLMLQKHEQDAAINVLRREGAIEVVIRK